ncbi:MAG: HD domain-containing phosphohydrolase [Candidatus Sulfotelmatobacter sp.]
MGDKILFVDDEPSSLTGYELMLRPNFEMDTAVGGEQGLTAVRERGPYAVVVSDMRMPGMNGAQFLARVRQAAPDTIRVILTGYSDITAAMDAVNEGNIFRLLAKPCNQEVLAKAITSGLVQYRLITAEKDLLENTLIGSIKVLTDVLGAVNPEVFGKSVRITRCVRHMVAKFHLTSSWCFEAAAMLSQLGCLMLDPELIQAAYVDTHLSAENRTRFEAHPNIARDLLGNVRRLEPVAWIISQQLIQAPVNPPQIPGVSAEILALGARMIKVSVAFDSLRMRGVSDDAAVSRLKYRSEFDRELIDALSDMRSEESQMELRKIPISTLAIGMVLQQNIRNRAGVLVVAKGQEVTRPLLMKLEHFSRARLIDNEILALIPV